MYETIKQNCGETQRWNLLKQKEQQLTACKRHNPAAGATQGYDRLHAKRYGQV
jgi:hypothetical protein